MSDTPRMRSALMDDPDVGFANVWKVGHDLERELNAALRKIDEQQEKINLFAKDNHEKYKEIIWSINEQAKLRDQVDRLRNAGDKLLFVMRDDVKDYVDWVDESSDAITEWNKARETK